MSPLSISYTYLQSTDPYTSLAIENRILDSLPEDSMHILFWVNRPCIVMGRFQNPFLECQIDRMIEDDILIVRRQSGGGCVYHDLGNLNYSFITNKKHHNKDNNHAILVEALSSLGISAYSTKRVDLFASHDGFEKKFSGSAFKEKKDSAFHHGTLLIDSDLDKLNYYLTPKRLSVKSVSIESVRSKVVNLSQLNSKLTIDQVINSIVHKAKEFYAVDVLNKSDLEVDKIHLDKIQNKNWYYGETPKFKIFDNVSGVGKLEIEIKKMKIISINIENCDVHESFIGEIASSLDSLSLLEAKYIDVLNMLGQKYEMYLDFISDLVRWLDLRFSVLRK